MTPRDRGRFAVVQAAQTDDAAHRTTRNLANVGLARLRGLGSIFGALPLQSNGLG